MKLALTLLALSLATTLGVSPVVELETTAQKSAVVTSQTAYKGKNPRYYQQLTPAGTNVSKLMYTVERYTHTQKIKGMWTSSEGWVINWYFDDGIQQWHKRENFGDAAHVAHDWQM